MNLFKKIMNLLFPRKIKCIFCGRDITNFDEKPYCSDCEKAGFFNDGEYRCKCCDAPLPVNDGYCYHCKTSHKEFAKNTSPFIYTDYVRKDIISLKSDNAKYLAEPMGKLMAKRVKEEGFVFDLIIPIPLSPKSLKKRGYNQSELLAIEVAKVLDKPLRTDILYKVKETKHQKELGFNDRQNNLRDAFFVNFPKDIKDKNILLVDDVMTTGATTNQCAKALKKYCNEVYVVTFARRDINNRKTHFSLKNLFKKKNKIKKNYKIKEKTIE